MEPTQTHPDPVFVELARKSVDQTEAAYELLVPVLAQLVYRTQTPEDTLGLVQALFRAATVLAQSTVGSPFDCQMRSAADAAALASAHWNGGAALCAMIAELPESKHTPPHFKRMKALMSNPTDAEVQTAEAMCSTPPLAKLAEATAAVAKVEAQPEPKQDGLTLGEAVGMCNSKGGVS